MIVGMGTSVFELPELVVGSSSTAADADITVRNICDDLIHELPNNSQSAAGTFFGCGDGPLVWLFYLSRTEGYSPDDFNFPPIVIGKVDKYRENRAVTVFDDIGNKLTDDQSKIDDNRIRSASLAQYCADKLPRRLRACGNSIKYLMLAVNCAEIHGSIFVPPYRTSQTPWRYRVWFSFHYRL